MFKSVKLFLFSVQMIFGSVAGAQEVISVSPYTPPALNDTPTEIPTVSFTPNLTLNLQLSCYAPNLRQTPMPAAPDAHITIEIGVRPSANRDVLNIIRVNDRTTGVVPAPVDRLAGWHFKPYYWASTAITDATLRNPIRTFNFTVSTPANGITGRASLRNNRLKVVVNGAYAAPANTDGDVDPTQINAYGVEFIRVSQTGAPNSAHAGSNGPVNANIRFRTSPDGRMVTGNIDVPAATRPGQIAGYQGGQPYTDFCGGWYSPLILYFDDKRPMFTGVSTFPIAEGSPVYWPEKNAPGYFLALDKNGDGQITELDELFGPEGSGDGFTKLKNLDSNSNGKIEASDSLFNKLLLWRDLNSDGKSQKKELFSLKSKKVIEIQLQSKNVIRSFGGRAESKAEAEFTFRQGKQIKTGAVWDVYFTQHLNLASTSKD